jgi:hypothetical protein
MLPNMFLVVSNLAIFDSSLLTARCKRAPMPPENQLQSKATIAPSGSLWGY